MISSLSLGRKQKEELSQNVAEFFGDRAPEAPVCRWANATHLWAGAVVGDGPSQDSPQFAQAMRRARRSMPIDRLLADAGYDAEHNHTLAREELGVRSTVINLNPRRSGRK